MTIDRYVNVLKTGTVILVSSLAATSCEVKEKELDAAAYIAPAPNPGFDPGVPAFATRKEFEKQMILSADKPDSEEYAASLTAVKRLAPNTRVVIRRVGNFAYKGYNPEYAEIEIVDGPEAGKRFFLRSNGLKVGEPTGRIATGASANAKTVENQEHCRALLNATITACKNGCRDRLSSLEPGAKREEAVRTCEGKCYEDPSLPKCN